MYYAYFSEECYKQISAQFLTPLHGTPSYGHLFILKSGENVLGTYFSAVDPTSKIATFSDEVYLGEFDLKLHPPIAADKDDYDMFRHEDNVTYAVKVINKAFSSIGASNPIFAPRHVCKTESLKAACDASINEALIEKPCRCCSRKNYMDAKTCWMCGASNPLGILG